MFYPHPALRCTRFSPFASDENVRTGLPRLVFTICCIVCMTAVCLWPTGENLLVAFSCALHEKRQVVCCSCDRIEFLFFRTFTVYLLFFRLPHFIMFHYIYRRQFFPCVFELFSFSLSLQITLHIYVYSKYIYNTFDTAVRYLATNLCEKHSENWQHFAIYTYSARILYFLLWRR